MQIQLLIIILMLFFLRSEYVNRFLQIYVHLRIILKAEIKCKIFP